MTETTSTLAQVAKSKRGKDKPKPELRPRKPHRTRQEIAKAAIERRTRETKERQDAIAEHWRIAAEEAIASGSIAHVRLPKLRITR